MMSRLTVSGSWLRDGRLRAIVGGMFWLVAVVVILPNPFDRVWAKLLLLLAALVLVPLALDLAARVGEVTWPNVLWQTINLVQIPAALLLGVSYCLPQGLLAASLAAPWLLTTGLIFLCGAWRIWNRGLKPLPSVCVDAGLIFLLVGGAWAVSDRLAFRPLDFDSIIVLLTAIHFHYAGFALPIVAGLASRQMPGKMATYGALGVVAGVPMVAIGITATQLQLGFAFELLAAWATALSAMLIGWLHLRLAVQPRWSLIVRGLWASAGLSLLGSMLLAAVYGSRFILPVPWLDIPWMRMLHGTANAIGFGLAGIVAWGLAVRR